MDETLQKIIERLEAQSARADELVEKAEAAEKEGNAEAITGFKAMLNDEIKPEIDRLKAERKQREAELEVKALRGSVEDLNTVIEELRKPAKAFNIGTTDGKSMLDEEAYEEGHSFYNDIRWANKGRTDAIERLGGTEGKAMSEGVGAQGGYLVQKSVERQIVETRELDNILRGLCSKLNVTTTEIELNQITLGTTAGWVAELATKPESTSMTLATVAAGVFTAAGLATISNQLLADSNPAVDALVTADLAKRLVALEETAFLVGSGTGQPLGLLNTPGITPITLTSTEVTDDDGLLDKILEAIAAVQTDVGQPSAIVMHPRTWTRVLKDKDAQGHYTIGSPTQSGYPNPIEPRSVNGPSAVPLTLFGVPVRLSNRIPTNLGGTTNESRVIVGDFTEALILDRQGITVDESPHVYFTSNQTVFRAEQRVGFTAARQPKAFAVIGGAGLATG